MNPHVIVSLGSIGLNLATPIILRARSNWELYEGEPARLDEIYPFTVDEVLYPPALEILRKDKTALPSFLSQVESLGVPPPVYNVFLNENTKKWGEDMYSLGAAGQRVIMSNGWVPSEETRLPPWAKWSMVGGATFFVDQTMGVFHWMTDNKIYSNNDVADAILFLQDTHILDAETAKEVREMAFGNGTLPNKYANMVPTKRAARRVLW